MVDEYRICREIVTRLGNRRISRVVGLMVLVLMASAAGLAWGTHELPTTCLPTPLPQEVGSPSYVLEDTEGSDQLRLELWRQPCLDGSGILVPLMRITPTKGTPIVCAFDVVQDGLQFDARSGRTATDSFCDAMLVPATFVLMQYSYDAHFDPHAAFTLFYNADQLYQLDIPEAEGIEPPVALTGTLTGFVPRQVLCVNPRTRQRVRAQIEGLRYDCTAAGLQTQPGDRIKLTIQGTVPGE